MRLRVLVGRLGLLQRARLEIDVVVTLGRAVDAIGPMQPGVEPLRRVGRCDLERQHGEELVIEGAGIRFAVEVAGLPAPIGPGAGEAVKHLLGRALALVRLIVGRIRCVRGARAFFGLRVRCAPPQPLRHARPRAPACAGRAMPALRKYFWARTSQATCDQPAGTSTSFCANTTEPSGLRISHAVVR